MNHFVWIHRSSSDDNAAPSFRDRRPDKTVWPLEKLQVNCFNMTNFRTAGRNRNKLEIMRSARRLTRLSLIAAIPAAIGGRPANEDNPSGRMPQSRPTFPAPESFITRGVCPGLTNLRYFYRVDRIHLYGTTAVLTLMILYNRAWYV